MGRPLFKPREPAPAAARIPEPKVALRRQRKAPITTDPETGAPTVELGSYNDLVLKADDPRVEALREANRRAKANLIKAGGRRLNVNLRPEAARALEALAKRLGGTDTAAIEHALIAAAKRRT